MSVSDDQLDLLLRGADGLGISLSSVQIGQFAQYLKTLEVFNGTYKLISATPSELIVKHLLDSLAAVPILVERIQQKQWASPRICDVGSGAGLPGIPLAIVMSDVRFVLIERSAKRCGFLRNACSVCNLSSRVEILEMNLSAVKDTFEVIVFRALHPLGDIIRDIGSVTTDDSIVAAYKGRYESVMEELESLRAVVRKPKDVRWDSIVIPLKVPFLDACRHLCLLSKRVGFAELEETND